MDLDLLSIHPAEDLTVGQCRDLGAHFYDRYAWVTNNREDLWRAAMALYLVRMAKLRGVTDDDITIYEVSHCIHKTGDPPYRRLAFIDLTIPRMVRKYLRATQGALSLNTMIEVTGLSR